MTTWAAYVLAGFIVLLVVVLATAVILLQDRKFRRLRYEAWREGHTVGLSEATGVYRGDPQPSWLKSPYRKPRSQP